MQMNEISSITIDNLKNNRLTDVLLEFYELKNVIENNGWHHNDSAYNHTISVLKNLEVLVKKYEGKIGRHLNVKIDKHTRGKLLFLSALLHDISKKETLKVKYGFTVCPNHESKGAFKAKRILKRFNLSEQELKFVFKIIKNHGAAGEMPDMGKEEYKKFKLKNRNIFVELVLLTFSDMLGTQLKRNNPDDFRRRLNFYKLLINSFYNLCKKHPC